MYQMVVDIHWNTEVESKNCERINLPVRMRASGKKEYILLPCLLYRLRSDDVAFPPQIFQSRKKVIPDIAKLAVKNSHDITSKLSTLSLGYFLSSLDS